MYNAVRPCNIGKREGGKACDPETCAKVCDHKICDRQATWDLT